jgi:tetratricopeptide (TPR) repeat protein
MQISVDPVWSRFARLFLGIGYLSNGQLQEAEHNLEEVMNFGEILDNKFITTSAYGLLNVILIAGGNISVGVNAVEHILGIFFENESRYHYATGEYFLGKVYSQIAQGHGPRNFAVLFKNLGFLLKNVPFAGKKAETHFNKAIEVAEEIGAKGILGQAKLDLALLHKAKGRTGQARKCISEAIEAFEQCEAEVFLKQAREILLSF